MRYEIKIGYDSPHTARLPYASPEASLIFLSQEQDVATFSTGATLDDMETIDIFDDLF